MLTVAICILADRSGAPAAEYAILIAFLVAAVAASVPIVNGGLNAVYSALAADVVALGSSAV